MNIRKSELQSYYRSRAPEYDRVYLKPERQADLRDIERWLPRKLADASRARGRVRHRLLDKIHRAVCGARRRHRYFTGDHAHSGRSRTCGKGPVPCCRRVRSSARPGQVRRGVRRVLVFPRPEGQAARVFAWTSRAAHAGREDHPARQPVCGRKQFTDHGNRFRREYISTAPTHGWLDTSRVEEFSIRGGTAVVAWPGSAPAVRCQPGNTIGHSSLLRRSPDPSPGARHC